MVKQLQKLIDLLQDIAQTNVLPPEKEVKNAVDNCYNNLKAVFRHPDGIKEVKKLLVLLRTIGKSDESSFPELLLKCQSPKLICAVVSSESINEVKEEENFGSIYEQLLDAINSIADISTQAKSSMVTGCLEHCLKILMRNDIDFRPRMEVLKSTNLLLENSPVSAKESLMKSDSFMNRLTEIFKQLGEYGDYEFQVGLIECLFRIIPRKQRDRFAHTLFSTAESADGLLNIQDTDFETDCRLFLNRFNDDFGIRKRVISLPCVNAFLGNKELFKPNDPGYDDFWVDFNISSKRVTVFCEQESGSQMSEDEMWETVTVWKDDLQNFGITEKRNMVIAHLFFKKSITDIFPSQYDTEGKELQLQFDGNFTVEDALQKTFGANYWLKKPKPKVSAVENPVLIQSDKKYNEYHYQPQYSINSQAYEDANHFSQSSQQTPSLSGRKVSVPCVPMSTPTRSISSLPLHPVDRLAATTSYVNNPSDLHSVSESFSSPAYSKVSEPMSSVRVCGHSPKSENLDIQHGSKQVIHQDKEFQVPKTPKQTRSRGKVKTPVVVVTSIPENGSYKSKKKTKDCKQKEVQITDSVYCESANERTDKFKKEVKQRGKKSKRVSDSQRIGQPEALEKEESVYNTSAMKSNISKTSQEDSAVLDQKYIKQTNCKNKLRKSKGKSQGNKNTNLKSSQVQDLPESKLIEAEMNNFDDVIQSSVSEERDNHLSTKTIEPAVNKSLKHDIVKQNIDFKENAINISSSSAFDGTTEDFSNNQSHKKTTKSKKGRKQKQNDHDIQHLDNDMTMHSSVVDNVSEITNDKTGGQKVDANESSSLPVMDEDVVIQSSVSEERDNHLSIETIEPVVNKSLKHDINVSKVKQNIASKENVINISSSSASDGKSEHFSISQSHKKNTKSKKGRKQKQKECDIQHLDNDLTMHSRIIDNVAEITNDKTVDQEVDANESSSLSVMDEDVVIQSSVAEERLDIFKSKSCNDMSNVVKEKSDKSIRNSKTPSKSKTVEIIEFEKCIDIDKYQFTDDVIQSSVDTERETNLESTSKAFNVKSNTPGSSSCMLEKNAVIHEYEKDNNFLDQFPALEETSQSKVGDHSHSDKTFLKERNNSGKVGKRKGNLTRGKGHDKNDGNKKGQQKNYSLRNNSESDNVTSHKKSNIESVVSVIDVDNESSSDKNVLNHKMLCEEVQMIDKDDDYTHNILDRDNDCISESGRSHVGMNEIKEVKSKTDLKESTSAKNHSEKPPKSKKNNNSFVWDDENLSSVGSVVIDNADKADSVVPCKPKQNKIVASNSAPFKKRMDTSSTECESVSGGRVYKEKKVQSESFENVINSKNSSTSMSFISKRQQSMCNVSRKSVTLYMAYSATERSKLPSEKGDAFKDPYDFDIECERLSGSSEQHPETFNSMILHNRQGSSFQNGSASKKGKEKGNKNLTGKEKNPKRKGGQQSPKRTLMSKHENQSKKSCSAERETFPMSRTRESGAAKHNVQDITQDTLDTKQVQNYPGKQNRWKQKEDCMTAVTCEYDGEENNSPIEDTQYKDKSIAEDDDHSIVANFSRICQDIITGAEMSEEDVEPSQGLLENSKQNNKTKRHPLMKDDHTVKSRKSKDQSSTDLSCGKKHYNTLDVSVVRTPKTPKTPLSEGYNSDYETLKSQIEEVETPYLKKNLNNDTEHQTGKHCLSSKKVKRNRKQVNYKEASSSDIEEVESRDVSSSQQSSHGTDSEENQSSHFQDSRSEVSWIANRCVKKKPEKVYQSEQVNRKVHKQRHIEHDHSETEESEIETGLDKLNTMTPVLKKRQKENKKFPVNKAVSRIQKSVIQTPMTPAGDHNYVEEENDCIPSVYAETLVDGTSSTRDLDIDDLYSFKSLGSNIWTPSALKDIEKEEEDYELAFNNVMLDLQSEVKSGPSTSLRPSRSLLKRKYREMDSEESVQSQEEIKNNSDEENEPSKLIPRKLFKEDKRAMVCSNMEKNGDRMTSNKMILSRSEHYGSEVASNKSSDDVITEYSYDLPDNEHQEMHTGVNMLLKAFSGDIQRQMQAKKQHLEALTKVTMKSSQKALNRTWWDQHNYRHKIMDDFKDKVMLEVLALEKDVDKLKTAEDETLTFFRQQLKTLENYRISQERRMKNLHKLQKNFTEQMKEAEDMSAYTQKSMKDVLRKDLSSLQKKLLVEAQQQELMSVKKSLQTMLQYS